ncbi:MAG: hypothetical protein R3A45_01070 [Bdellovibrionota bacterium]
MNIVKKTLLLATIVATMGITTYQQAQARRSIVTIEIGQDYNKYSKGELRRRVWELERAVQQLQEEVFQIKVSQQEPAQPSWVCSVKAMGETYTGMGPTQAVAKSETLQACKDGNNGSSFHCGSITCEQ